MALQTPEVIIMCQQHYILQESYDDGAYLVRQGEPGNYLFVVETGEVICTHRYTGDLGEPQEVLSLMLFMVQNVLFFASQQCSRQMQLK